MKISILKKTQAAILSIKVQESLGLLDTKDGKLRTMSQ